MNHHFLVFRPFFNFFGLFLTSVTSTEVEKSRFYFLRLLDYARSDAWSAVGKSLLFLLTLFAMPSPITEAGEEIEIYPIEAGSKEQFSTGSPARVPQWTPLSEPVCSPDWSVRRQYPHP